MPASDALTELLDGHVAVAEAAGSRFYAALLERMRDDAAAGGPVRTALQRARARPDRRMGRLPAAGRACIAWCWQGTPDELRKHFPSTGGDGDAAAAWPAIQALIASGRAELVEALAHPLQTNAPTRSKALVGAHCLVAQRTGLPLRLLELGASAGLNLRVDRFRYEQDGVAFGPPHSPVRFVDFLTGGRPPLALRLHGRGARGLRPQPDRRHDRSGQADPAGLCLPG